MRYGNKHKDHDYVVARQERYIETYRKGDPKAMMEWMDLEDFEYSDFGGGREGMKHDDVEKQFHNAFANFHDLNVKTRSLHGHRHFTAWEWEITCKPGLDETGKRLSKRDAKAAKIIGCTLMWWNDKDKIIRNHDYVQQRDP